MNNCGKKEDIRENEVKTNNNLVDIDRNFHVNAHKFTLWTSILHTE